MPAGRTAGTSGSRQRTTASSSFLILGRCGIAVKSTTVQGDALSFYHSKELLRSPIHANHLWVRKAQSSFRLLFGTKRESGTSKGCGDEEACLQPADEAMLKASLGFMYSHGFRARSQPGHHIAIIKFVRSRINKKHTGVLTMFDRLRRKRNLALYDDTGFVSQPDAEEALRAAGGYFERDPS